MVSLKRHWKKHSTNKIHEPINQDLICSEIQGNIAVNRLKISINSLLSMNILINVLVNKWIDKRRRPASWRAERNTLLLNKKKSRERWSKTRGDTDALVFRAASLYLKIMQKLTTQIQSKHFTPLYVLKHQFLHTRHRLRGSQSLKPVLRIKSCKWM